MPTLRELKGQFIAYRRETAEEMAARGVAVPADYFRHVGTLPEAHGIQFVCPKAFAKCGDLAHRVQIYFVGSPVPPHLGTNKKGEAVRWMPTGSGLDDLTLAPSIAEEDDVCKWHGFVTKGNAL